MVAEKGVEPLLPKVTDFLTTIAFATNNLWSGLCLHHGKNLL